MLLRLSELDFPTPPERLFGRSGPFVLEVGFGDGRFIAEVARRRTEWNWLGAEVSSTSVQKAHRRLRRQGIRHVRLYHGPGTVLLRNLVPPGSLHKVYVNFPDPWPKKRHRGNRLLQVPFMELLSTRLADGGSLLLTTDHAEYCQYSVDQGRSSGLFSVVSAPVPAAALNTKYAVKWREQDKPIYHVVFEKTGEAAPHNPIERFEMPHAILDGTLPTPDQFEKRVEPFDGGHVVLLRAYSGVARDALLFMVQVEEAELSQKVLIEARPHADDGVHLSLVRFGDPLVTDGVKAAVGFVADWLVEQGLALNRRSY
jgi:tRNA (guanine-N7-)-methyltransferase